jgi:hypothetical protein
MMAPWRAGDGDGRAGDGRAGDGDGRAGDGRGRCRTAMMVAQNRTERFGRTSAGG